MAAMRDHWERVGNSAYVRAKPPRTMAEAIDDDRSLIFVIAVTSAEGREGWTVRLSTRDDPDVFHPDLGPAMDAADRLIERLRRVNSSLIAAEAGLDPAEWSFEARHPVGGGLAFVNRREPTLCVAREVDGDRWRIMRGSIAARGRFADPRAATAVLSGHAAVTPPEPRPRTTVVDGDDMREPGSRDAVVDAVTPVGGAEPVPVAYAGDEAAPYTHVATLSLTAPRDGSVHKAPLTAGDADRLTVGDDVGIVFGPRRPDGRLPIRRILVRAPEPTPGP